MIIFLLFICFWIGLSFRYQIIIFAIAISSIIFIIFYKYKKKIGLIAIGLALLGVGISYIKFDFKKEIYSGIVIDSHPNYFIMLSGTERLYTYNKENQYEIGDYLSITGEKEELSFVTLESQFDFKDYLNKKGVYYSLKSSKIEVKFSNPIRIRQRREKFLNHFSKNQKSLINALLFSINDHDGVLEDMDSLHLARLASATGIYIYAYLHLFSFILSYFIKDKRLKIISVVTLLPYAIFTFPRFTVMRIILVEILSYINEAFLDKKFKHLEIVAVSGFFFLIINYHLAYQTSFIIGYSMPFMIFAIRDAGRQYKRWRGKIFQMIMVYLLFIPFELKFYNGINPLSLVIQFMFTPLFIFLAVLSLLCFYGVPLYAVADLSGKGVSNLLGWLGKLAFQINGPPLNGWMILLFVVIFLLYCYYKGVGFIPIHRWIVGIFVCGLILYCLPIHNFVTAEVSFINVGQGDSCLVRKSTTTVLIDTGGLTYTDLATETLIPYLQKKRIYNIDMVITTHNDFDHVGALDSLKENYHVKRVVQDATSFPINIGGITFNNYNNHTTTYSEDNNKSLVVGFTLINKTFLIMGDAPKEVEKNIIREYPNLDCDILKVGHHGSKTSTSEEFVKFVTPDEAIISCGINNKYGHPHKEVVDILKRNHVTIRRTDIDGTITYSNYIWM